VDYTQLFLTNFRKLGLKQTQTVTKDHI